MEKATKKAPHNIRGTSMDDSNACNYCVSALDCMVQHINTFLKQARNEQIADFGQPCTECMHRNECKFDWLSKMQPVLQRSNVKINLVRKEH